METRVGDALRRNNTGRLRIGRIDVEITLETEAGDSKRVARCLGLFEDYCVVTASIRKGIEVRVTVLDSGGNRLFCPGEETDE